MHYLDLRKGWTTAHELNFISRLGTHAALLQGHTRQTLLQRYQYAISRRSVWGAVSESEVRMKLAAEVK